MNNFDEFIKGRIIVPSILECDAYTIAGDCLASESAKNASIYDVVLRYSPEKVWPTIAQDSRMCLYGLSDYIRENLTKRITRDNLNDSSWFMSQAKLFGGGLKFNRDMWESIIDHHDGYLPIRISALPEGSVFYPNEPVIQVQSLFKGYGEIAAHVEAVMLGMVSIASAKVTLLRHWLERIIDWLELPRTPKGYEQAQYFLTDFGMRASSVSSESELLGRAQLLVMHGTDTFNAAYQASRMGCKSQTGKSLLALAHRIVQGWDTEGGCYRNLLEQDDMGSHVADCYSFNHTVKNILIPLAKENPTKLVIIRPDSGDHIDNNAFVINCLREMGMVDSEGNTGNVKIIHGDSINPESMFRIIQHTKSMGINPRSFLIFGVGGWTRNQSTRDTLSASYKLSSVRINGYGDWSSVVKLSESVTKLSVPGPSLLCRDSSNITVRHISEPHYLDARVTYYNGSGDGLNNKFLPPCYEQFSTIQDRVINSFNDSCRGSKFGTGEDSCWSDKIKSIQKEYYDKYRQ